MYWEWEIGEEWERRAHDTYTHTRAHTENTHIATHNNSTLHKMSNKLSLRKWNEPELKYCENYNNNRGKGTWAGERQRTRAREGHSRKQKSRMKRKNSRKMYGLDRQRRTTGVDKLNWQDSLSRFISATSNQICWRKNMTALKFQDETTTTTRNERKKKTFRSATHTQNDMRVKEKNEKKIWNWKLYK